MLSNKLGVIPQSVEKDLISLALPDRFFPFLFVVAEKRVWSGSHTHLVLAPRKVTIEHVIVAQVYCLVRLLFGL